MCDGAKPPVALQKKSASGHLCLSVWVVWVGGRGWKDGRMGGRAGGLGGRAGGFGGRVGGVGVRIQTNRQINK